MSDIILVKQVATRYHDFSAGHRVYGHENKCSMLHGHNYRVTFTCEASSLDGIGRVIDFSVMKTKLCDYLEHHWDHRFLIWVDDPWYKQLVAVNPSGVVGLRFNPTAENMASHLLSIGPTLLHSSPGVRLVKVLVEETRKCSAEAELL